MSDSDHVCQITTVHPRFDSRIFHKQCRSLAAAGYRVTLVVNDGRGSAEAHGVHLVDLGGTPGRVGRILVGLPKALFAAWRSGARICHVHDPELVPVGLVLALGGRRVVYDAHEDLPNDIYNKPWVPRPLRGALRSMAVALEWSIARAAAACVAVTPGIRERLAGYGARAVLVRNYPARPDPPVHTGRAREVGADTERFTLCYAGGISLNRGVREMIEAAALTRCRLILMGRFAEPAVFAELEASEAWHWVDYRGQLPREAVEAGYRESDLGLVLLHPDTNYVNCLPIKLFEYMQFGLPVVASDFPGWAPFVIGAEAGLAVHPLDVEAIVRAIETLRDDPERARALGENGRRAIERTFNWESEFETLRTLYVSIGGQP